MKFTKSKWPENYFDVFGSVTDKSFVRPQQLKFSHDKPKESFDTILQSDKTKSLNH